MNSFNSVDLTGYVSSRPRMESHAGHHECTSEFTLAVYRIGWDTDNHPFVTTDWFPCYLWSCPAANPSAEFLPGMHLRIAGELTTIGWVDAENGQHSRMIIHVLSYEVLDTQSNEGLAILDGIWQPDSYR